MHKGVGAEDSVSMDLLSPVIPVCRFLKTKDRGWSCPF